MADYNVEERFKEKLFSQFRDSTMINELFEVYSVAFQDTVDVIEFILGQKTIDEREGDLLDKLGTRLGVRRPDEQEPPENLFTLIDPGEVGLESQGFSDEDYPTEGGYFAEERGLPLVSNPDQRMDDVGYRRLLKQKAESFRRRGTRENLFEYLLAFGARCLIDDDATLDIEFDPVDYDEFSDFERWYVIAKGFKPAGISTKVRERMRNGDSI